ncbi:MAG: hypothetical protein AAB570_01130, partial [Patescibacteria group bacterium]
TFVFNAIVPEMTQIAERTQARAVPFKHMQTLHHDEEWFYDGSRELFQTRDVRIPGRHNRDNVLAVLTVAKELGIDTSHVHEVIKTFEGLPHRLECVGTFKGIEFYDDAVASSPDPTMAAILTFGKHIGSIILGGKNSGFEFGTLAHTIVAVGIPTIVSLPGARAEINGALAHADYRGKIVEVSSMKEAVEACYRETPKGTIALLSTATQSYDMFKNFEQQGDAFKREVIAQGKEE